MKSLISIQNFFPPIVRRLARDVKKQGGRALVVGGAVRDFYLNVPTKDFDVEVYGLSAARVEKIVRTFGRVSDVGRSFGILKVRLSHGGELDVSLPRRDSKVAPGHRGFAVKADPFMSVQEAARRRDFTINALVADPLTGEVFDYFGGIKDAQRRVLRVTDFERFSDDPLRALRAVQMIGRFGLRLEPTSSMIIKQMVPRLRELPKERITEEWKKLFLKAKRPSLGLQVARRLGILKILFGNISFSSFSRIDRVPADWTIRLAAFCFNLSKQETRRVLDVLGAEKFGTAKVEKLVAYKRSSKINTAGGLRCLARELSPATIRELSTLLESQKLLQQAQRLGIADAMPKDVLQGRELLVFGFAPGEKLGGMIAWANYLHDTKGYSKKKITDLFLKQKSRP